MADLRRASARDRSYVLATKPSNGDLVKDRITGGSWPIDHASP
jgi:hypothetical protein